MRAAQPVTPQEIAEVLGDLSWLDRCTCSPGREVGDFFVDAGQTIAPQVLADCRACPTRRQELIFAYARDLRHGYHGGLSPAQRAALPLQDALALVDAELPAAG